MQFCELNPFVRCAMLQPSILSSAPLGCARDHRIFYVLQGSAELVLKNSKIAVTPGMLLYLCPATPYYFNGSIKAIVLNFDLTRRYAHLKKALPISKSIESFGVDNILEQDAPDELKRLIVVNNAKEREQELKECLQHFSYPTAYSEALCSANIKRLLCYLLQKENEPSQNMPRLVREVLLYIQQHYNTEISNDQIAEEFGYHSFYLNRVFKKATGSTIHQALITQKMDVAKQLLENTELLVKSIAYEVGFSNSALFCNTFKKHTGVTPSEYRLKRS